MEIENIKNIPHNSLERVNSGQDVESQPDQEDKLEKLIAELNLFKKEETKLYYDLISKESGYLKIEKNIKIFQKELKNIPQTNTEKIDFAQISEAYISSKKTNLENKDQQQDSKIDLDLQNYQIDQLRNRLNNLKQHPLLQQENLPEGTPLTSIKPVITGMKTLAQTIYKPNNQKKSFLMSEKLLDLMNENTVLDKYLHSESFRSQVEGVIGLKYVLEEMKSHVEDIDERYIEALNKEESELKKHIKSQREEFQKEQDKIKSLKLELEQY